MQVHRLPSLFICSALAVVLFVPAAIASERYWSDDGSRSAPAARADAQPSLRMMRLDLDGIGTFLETTPKEKSAEPGRVLQLPLPGGGTATFSIRESSIMEAELAAKFPEIRTWAGQGIDEPTASVRLDITPHGFHAIVFSAAGTIYIDPESSFSQTAAKDDRYRVYFKRDAVRTGGAPKRECFAAEEKERNPVAGRPVLVSGRAAAAPSGSELRDYRVAVATTAEYTAFHGGTVALGLAAVVTAMNRVVGIYEREVAVTMTLVADNNLVIYTNMGTDPYSNNDGFAMLSQNQSTLDSVIGSADYDIGHVFSTGGGGVASLEVPCVANQKGRGVTGQGSPIGDSFYVDYVAHEMGHQFGGEHTFNGTAGSCSGGNRNASTAYEPGSGTTIMAYAGICSPQNIASNSDDHFHTASFDEITAYTQTGNGNACPTTTATGNSAPVPDAGAGGFTIPISTPFTLTGSATDPDLNPLIYRWEQFDTGPAGAPNSPSDNAPLFRSFSASSNASRTFPQWSDILNNTQTIGELLPDYTRSLTFRFTALDNLAGGGGVDHDNLSFDVTDTAGPFLVSHPNTAISVTGLDVETATWTVAGTTAAPVSCANVDILFSDDGGVSFATTLLSSTPNDGSADIVIPNVTTSQARVQVACSDNVFFDVGDTNFTVTALSTPTFTIGVTPDPQALCVGETADYQVDVGSVLGFSDLVDLSVSGVPAPASASFSTDPVTPPGISTLTLSNTAGLSVGSYSLQVTGQSGATVANVNVGLDVSSGGPSVPSILAPAIGATGISVSPTLSWSAVAGATAYSVEIATDAAFTSIADSGSGGTTSFTPGSPLDIATGYFWRVVASSSCGAAFQATGSFVTDSSVSTCSSPSLAIPDGTGVPVSDAIVVGVAGTIMDVDVPLDVTHTYIGDLTAGVEHGGTTTTVTLLDRPGLPAIDPTFGCGNNNIDVVLDDEGGSAAENACAATPPAMSGNLTPTGSLDDFDGMASNTTWTLDIADNENVDQGTLNSWCVDIRYSIDLTDGDLDGVPDIIDNCPGDANADQADQDGDGLGVPCDSDIDGDLMPNDWETGFGLNPLDPTDADEDLDGDGLTNLQEFQGGTDPTIGEVCGDGIVTASETCDDSGTTPGDGCDGVCQIESGWSCSGVPSLCSEVCGDGIVTASETCDDSGTTPGDGCDAACQIESGWSCSGVPSLCSEVCGDGIVTASETCDDSGTTPGDGCDGVCQIESGWSCSGVPSLCSEVCGDGFISASETCDDSGTTPGDGCDAACQIESGWSCSGVPSLCSEVCGDGFISASETCDDSGTTPGDGCDGVCQIESGYVCSGAPSVCQVTAVPALSPWSIGLLATALMSSACWAYRRRDVTQF